MDVNADCRCLSHQICIRFFSSFKNPFIRSDKSTKSPGPAAGDPGQPSAPEGGSLAWVSPTSFPQIHRFQIQSRRWLPSVRWPFPCRAARLAKVRARDQLISDRRCEWCERRRRMPNSQPTKKHCILSVFLSSLKCWYSINYLTPSSILYSQSHFYVFDVLKNVRSRIIM